MPHLLFLRSGFGGGTSEDITSLFFPDSTLEYIPDLPTNGHGPFVMVNHTFVTSYNTKVGYHEIGKDRWIYFKNHRTVGKRHAIVAAFGYIWLIAG